MTSSNTTKLLGDVVLKNDGSSISTEVICNQTKVLGLYFSSFTCPSCSAFTPELIRFYTCLKQQNDKGFEVLYISSDCEETQFNDHIKNLPWVSIPISDGENRKALRKTYKIQSIPALILLDSKTCDIITVHGKSSVSDDPEGRFFPWCIRDPVEVLNELSLVTPNGSQVELRNMDTCVKGLYFSAHWCPPCKAFTPHLVKLYKKLEKKGHKFEVIFVSSDLSEQSFSQYYSTMPWLAVPYEEHYRRKELAQLYGVEGIPSLIVLNEDNNIITKEGRIEINDDPEGEDFPWKPKMVDELSEKHVTKLNEEPCLILFSAFEEKELDAAHFLLLPVAEEYKARVQRAKTEDTPIPMLNFFYAGDAEICDSVRDAVQVGDRFPFVVLLDMTKNQKFVLETQKEITTDVVGKFVRDFLASKLTAYPVGL